MKIYSGIIGIFICLACTLNIFSQGEIQKEVKVIKPYTPTLSEAGKVNLLPEFNDTIRVNPDYGYKIYPRRYETQFKIIPIKPAKIVALPLTKLYKSQLTLGVGNYATLFADLNINELRSKTTAIGFNLRHLSSSGKIKLENGNKVDSDFSDNIAGIYGKKMFNKSVLEGGISGGYNTILFYGYNPTIDTILLRQKIKQKISSAGANIRYYSSHPDSTHFNYDFGLNYDFTVDGFKNKESGFDFNSRFSNPIGDAFIGGDLRLRSYQFSGDLDTSSNFIVNINPFYSKKTSDWKFLVGLNTSFDSEGINLYPRAEFEFDIVKNVLLPYFGVGGYSMVNNFRKIIFENQYIIPGLRVKNTDYTLIGFAGLKGGYSSKMSYNLKGSYSRIDNMYFYVNSSDTLGNQFDVVYDGIGLMTFNGEVTWHKSDKLNLILKTNLYKYTLDALEKPWHRPLFELALGAGYNLRDKILFNGNLFFTGKRFARGTGTEIVELNPYLDANMAFEYRYTKILSFFVRFNNLSASKYQIWNQYPVQRFQILGGFSYSL